MSILERDKVDGLGQIKGARGIVMFLADHLPWDNKDEEYDHLIKLHDKLSAYIVFIESKEYLRIYPELKYPVEFFSIEIHFKYKPSENAVEFIKVVAQQFAERNIYIKAEVAVDYD